MVYYDYSREKTSAVGTLLVKHGFSREGTPEIDVHEEAPGAVVESPFPKPVRRRRLTTESYSLSIEETYFWLYNFLTVDMGYSDVIKVSDYFTSSESSSFFGINMQRLAAQQEKVAQYLGTIANMIKSLFQIVRELRILDERLKLYEDSMKPVKPDHSAEVSLKGYWIDLVEGGAKNPSSVYGMAREVGFTTLPDLFFSAPPMSSDKVDDYVEKLEGFNRKVREVLGRKLKVFLLWKESTYKELKNRRKFTVKYLSQHYNVIQMYATWIMPYLKNIKRMTHKDLAEHPELIAGFEGTLLEIELLATKGQSDSYASCISLYIFYRTQPNLGFQTEGYQRGPIHVGKAEIDFRAYAWNKSQIKAYLDFRKEERQDLLMSVNESVKAAYEALGDDLQKYLKEAQEETAAKKEEAGKKEVKPLKSDFLGPVGNLFEGFGELFGSFFQIRCPKCGKLNSAFASSCVKCGVAFKKEEKKEDKYKSFTEYSEAKKKSNADVWKIYNTYKKAHRMITW